MSNILLLIVREVPLKGQSKAILKSLADFANNDTHLTIPSYKTLAKDIGCSRRTAINCIKSLVDLELIRKDYREINDRQTSNSYSFNVPKLIAAIPDQEKRMILAERFAVDRESIRGKVIKLHPRTYRTAPP